MSAELLSSSLGSDGELYCGQRKTEATTVDAMPA